MLATPETRRRVHGLLIIQEALKFYKTRDFRHFALLTFHFKATHSTAKLYPHSAQLSHIMNNITMPNLTREELDGMPLDLTVDETHSHMLVYNADDHDASSEDPASNGLPACSR